MFVALAKERRAGKNTIDSNIRERKRIPKKISIKK